MSSTKISSTTTTKPQVLIVDDEEKNRLAIAEILTEIALEPLFCASGQEALDAIRKNHPALIILDAEMPELDGYQVINQMHADEELSHIPVLLLTPNLSNEKQLQYASLVELIECVAKPVSAEVLKAKVQILLQLDFYQHSIVELLNEDQQIVRKKQEGVIGLDSNGKIIYVNAIAAKLLKTSTSELVGLYFESLFEEPNDHVVSVWQDHPIRRVCAEGNILQIDQVYLWRADGVSVKVKLAAIPFMEKSGTLDILMAFKLRRAKRGTQNNITQLMGMDHLTGLPNRTRFEDHLRTQITLANGIGLQIAVLFIDLSHFRHINQTLGHEFGDALLKEISQRLKAAVRSSDYLARISGDTFAVLATLNQDITDAGVVARKILKQLKESFLIHGHEVFAASHIGVATYPHSGDTPVALLKNAQTAAERAKSLGGNAYQFFTTEMNKEVVQKMLLEQDFHRALDQHVLKIDFEPIFDREHQAMVGYESIVRWPRAGKEPLLLADFLPIAERAGLSDRFNGWLLEESCKYLQTKIRERLPHLMIWLRITPTQLLRPGFVELLDRRLGVAELNHRHLVIELSGDALGRPQKERYKIIESLAERGVKIALADFGMGYAPIKMLSDLPLSIVKLPNRHSSSMKLQEQYHRVITHLSQLVHEFGLKVWMDHVNNQNDFDQLNALKIDFMQGQYFRQLFSK